MPFSLQRTTSKKMHYTPRIFCKLMSALITGIVLVTPSCLPNPFEDSSFDGSGDALSSASSNTSMLEGIWYVTLEYLDSGNTSLIEVEFLSSGQALYFLQEGQDLFSVDPYATVQCDVSSSFTVNVNVQYSYEDLYSGEYVSCEIAMVGTMDPTGDYLSASGTKTSTTSAGVVIDTIYASSTKGAGSGSANTWMLDGVWEGAVESNGWASVAECEFLPSGQGVSFLMDGEDIFSADPQATLQCDVSSSFAVLLDAQYTLYIDEIGAYASVTIALEGTMDPAGDSLDLDGLLTLTVDGFSTGPTNVYSSFTKRAGLLRGDGEGPWHNPWHGDDLLSTER
jgi:hypothetical protein